MSDKVHRGHGRVEEVPEESERALSGVVSKRLVSIVLRGVADGLESDAEAIDCFSESEQQASIMSARRVALLQASARVERALKALEAAEAVSPKELRLKAETVSDEALAELHRSIESRCSAAFMPTAMHYLQVALGSVGVTTSKAVPVILDGDVVGFRVETTLEIPTDPTPLTPNDIIE